MLLIQENPAHYRPATTEELAHALQVSLKEHFTRTLLDSSKLIKPFLSARYALQHRETLGLIVLSNKLEFLAIEEIAHGDVDSIHVSVRTVVEAVLKHPGNHIALFHNHPSGSNTASPSDIKFTRKCLDALQLFEIKLLDHFIVAGADVVSLRNSYPHMWNPPDTWNPTPDTWNQGDNQ